MVSPVPTRRAAINGIELSFVDEGDEGRPVVVLCHGFPELAYSWRHQIPALTGAGIAPLREAILESVAPKGAWERETGFITSLRHEQLLRESAAWLEKARTAVESAIPHEMLLLDLYAALRPIDAITGATTADDILNRIFSTFCIGK